MKMPPATFYFTASQLAVVLNVSRKRAHQHMAGADRFARTETVRGVQARVWPLSALPAALAAELGVAVARGGYRNLEHLFTAPPALWQPEHPLASLAPAAVQKAEMHRDVLAPILAARDAQMVAVSELVRRAALAFAEVNHDTKTAGHWAVRHWIEDAIERDRGRWDWRRVEIYLDAKPALKAATVDPDAAGLADACGDDLAGALDKVRDRTAPSDDEAAEVWNAVFHRFNFLLGKDVSDAKAKRALHRILERSGLPLLADGAKARSAAWKRRFQKWQAGGRCADAVRDGRQFNARPEVFDLSDAEEAALRKFRLEKGSINLAVRWFLKSRACRMETRLLIEKALDEAARRQRPVNWPMSLRRAAEVTVEEEAKFRGEKAYGQYELLRHRGQWYDSPEGERLPMRPNVVWEADDMSINEPFCFLDPETDKAVAGRQTLCIQDAYSRAWLGVMPVGRVRDAYRVEDQSDLILEAVREYGLPMIFRIERGPWENNFFDGIPLADGTRWGGLGALFHIERVHTSRGKGGIESSFNLLQSLLAHESLTIGRKRGEFEAATKTLVKARNGDPAAVAKFWTIGECANAMRDAMREFNAMPKQRRAFGRKMVAPDDLHRHVEKHECPESEFWRFCPEKREATVRRGNVECWVKNYPHKFCFRVNGNTDLYLENGYPVLIAFHPGHPERGCHVFNAERGARNREGRKVGEFLVLAESIGEMPQFGAMGQHSQLVAGKKANAAVAQEFRAIKDSQVRVSVSRDGHGKSRRLESGTGGALVDRSARSIKEQRAELRKEQADQYAREAEKRAAETARKAAQLPARRLAAKLQCGVWDDEVEAHYEAERAVKIAAEATAET